MNALSIQLCTQSFVQSFTDFVDQHNLKDNQFGLEVTETAELADLALARESLQLLQSKGIKIAWNILVWLRIIKICEIELPNDVVKLINNSLLTFQTLRQRRLVLFQNCVKILILMIGEGIETEEEKI